MIILHVREQKSFKISEHSSEESIQLHEKIADYNKNVRDWNNMVDDVLERSPEYYVLHPSDHDTDVNKSINVETPTQKNEYTHSLLIQPRTPFLLPGFIKKRGA